MRQTERKMLDKCRVFWRMAVVFAFVAATMSATALAAPLVPGIPSGENAYEKAQAYAAPEGPPQALPTERPVISIQLSAICNKDGSLNQTAELALILNLPAGETFAALNTALWFNPQIMTPITFACQPVNGIYTPDLTLGATPINVPGLMNQNLNTLDARADATGNLVFSAKAGVPTDFPVDTDTSGPITLAVIRFALVGTDKFSFSKTEPQKLLYGGNPTDISNFVKFQDDAMAADSIVNAAVTYTSGKTSFYHVPAYDKVDTGTWTNAAVPGTEPPIMIPRPNTDGKTVLAVDTAKPDTDSERYSYLTNHIPNVSIPNLITGGSFDGKLDPDEFCAVSFRDWSGEELGTLILPMYTDVRQRVQDYVAKWWIHPDLLVRDYASLARTDTYRGKYPHEGPSGASTTQNGSDYPLTNKLDYAFLTQKMVKNANSWAVDKTNPDAAKYPFTYGWMVDAPGTDTWSTMGVGELADYVVADGSLPISDKNTYVDFVDFERLENRNEIAHATYRPGVELKSLMLYRIADTPAYTRYTKSASPDGATYSIQFTYERVYDAGGNKLYGTSRVRQPSIQFGMKPDIIPVGQTNDKSSFTYVEILRDSGELIEADITPTSKINAVNYALIDRYNFNFMTGTQRSAKGNALGIPDNFDYEHYSYGEHQGSAGFVMDGTVRCLLDEASKAERNESNEFEAHWKLGSVQDLNLRKDGGASYTDADEAKPVFRAMVNAALAGGGEFVNAQRNATLTWHQMQYYFIHGELKTVAELNADAEGGVSLETYTWCRQYDGCRALTSIDTLAKLLTGAHNGNLSGLTLDFAAGAPFYLWQAVTLGDTTSCRAYTDLETLKTDIIAAVQGVPGGFDYTTLTLGQLQYHLIHKSYPADMAAAQTEADGLYWWLFGGKKVTDWASLIVAAKAAQGGFPASLNTITNTAIGGAPYYLRADTNGTPFATQTAMVDALKAAVDTGTNTWEEVQQRIIGSGIPDTDYWWGYGGRKLTEDSTDADLIWNLGLAKQGHTAPMGTLTWAMAEGKPFYFRNSFSGAKITGADDAAKLNTLNTFLQDAITAGANNWPQLQYHIIHRTAGDFQDFSAASAEAGSFYWWKYNINPEINPYDFTTLVEAAFRAEKNGDPRALDTLVVGNLATMWFSKGTPTTAANFAALDKFTTADDLANTKAWVRAMVSTYIADHGGGLYAIPQFTWYQVQHYLVQQAYAAADSPDVADQIYWWNKNGINPNAPKPWDNILTAMLAWAENDDDTALGDIDRFVVNDLSFVKNMDEEAFKKADIANIVLPNLKALAKWAYDPARRDQYFNGTSFTIDWYQLQYAFITPAGDLSGYNETLAKQTYIWYPY